MAPEAWLEQGTTTLDDILRTEFGVEVDRAVLAHLVDQRRGNLARALQLSVERAQDVLTDDDLREIAAHIARNRRGSSAVA